MKALKIALTTAGVLLAAGCGNKPADNSNEAVKDAAQSETGKQAQTETANEMIKTIADAMASGKAMQCTYTIKDKNGEGMTATAYVDGEKYKTDTEMAGNVTHTLFDSEAMYTWTEGQTGGMKMTKACMEEMAKNAPGENENVPAPAPEPGQDETFQGATDVSCEEASGVDFSIPQNVTFSDQCEALKNLQSIIPSGVDMPDGIPNMPQMP